MMARKRPGHRIIPLDTPCRFNGAAPMMARKLQSPYPHQFGPHELQWSRANDGAETEAERLERRKRTLLQWSRANDGAETGNPRIIASRCPRLQWSRANDGAETLNQELSGPTAQSFNGAAPMMARKRWGWGGEVFPT